MQSEEGDRGSGLTLPSSPNPDTHEAVACGPNPNDIGPPGFAANISFEDNPTSMVSDLHRIEQFQEPPGLAEPPANPWLKPSETSARLKEHPGSELHTVDAELHQPIRATAAISIEDAAEEARLYDLKVMQPWDSETGFRDAGEDSHFESEKHADQLVDRDVPGLESISGSVHGASNPVLPLQTGEGTLHQNGDAVEVHAPEDSDKIFQAKEVLGDVNGRHGDLHRRYGDNVPEDSSIQPEVVPKAMPSEQFASELTDQVAKAQVDSMLVDTTEAYRTIEQVPAASDGACRSPAGGTPERLDRSASAMADSDSDDSLIINELRPASPIARGATTNFLDPKTMPNVVLPTSQPVATSQDAAAKFITGYTPQMSQASKPDAKPSSFSWKLGRSPGPKSAGTSPVRKESPAVAAPPSRWGPAMKGTASAARPGQRSFRWQLGAFGGRAQGTTEKRSHSGDQQKASQGPKSLTWRRKESDQYSPPRQRSADRRSQTSQKSRRQATEEGHSASAENPSHATDPEASPRIATSPISPANEAPEPMMEAERTLACQGQIDIMWQARYTPLTLTPKPMYGWLTPPLLPASTLTLRFSDSVAAG